MNETKGVESLSELRRSYEYTLDRIGVDAGSGVIWQEYIAFLQTPRVGTPAYQALFGSTHNGQEETQRIMLLRSSLDSITLHQQETRTLSKCTNGLVTRIRDTKGQCTSDATLHQHHYEPQQAIDSTWPSWWLFVRLQKPWAMHFSLWCDAVSIATCVRTPWISFTGRYVRRPRTRERLLI